MLLRWSTLLALSLNAFLVAGLPAPKGLQNNELDGWQKAKLALCVVDVSQASLTLGEAGLAVNEAAEVCGELHEEQEKQDERLAEGHGFDPRGIESYRNLCTASVGGILEGVLEVAQYLSGAASNCAADVNLKAYCAADNFGFLSGLAKIVEGSAGIAEACVDKEDSIEAAGAEGTRRLRAKQRRSWLMPSNSSSFARSRPGGPAYTPVSPALWGALMRPDLNLSLDRRLGDADLEATAKEMSDLEEQMAEALKEDKKRKADQAVCAVDVIQASLYIARAGLALNSATKDCSHEFLKAEGEISKMACSVDVNGVIASFAYVARFLSVAVIACPSLANNNAACSASIFTILAGLGNIAVVGSSYGLTCGGKEAQESSGDEKDEVLPLRRLSDEIFA